MHALKEIDLPGQKRVFNTACSDPRPASNLFDYLDPAENCISESVNMTSKMAQSEPIAIVGSACRFPRRRKSIYGVMETACEPP